MRCSLAYLSTRLDRIQKVAWGSGKSIPAHIAENLSPAEINYFDSYVEALDTYNKEYAPFCSGIDLTVDLTPPKELYIEVRVKKDYGEVLLPESGAIHLQKGSVHLLKRSEVDGLIKKGIMDEVV